MKKIILLMIFIFLIDLVSALRINEIMYNPAGNDNNKEFIEIYGTNNLTNYIIGDSETNDSLIIINYNNKSNYSLIIEEGFNISLVNCSVFSAGSSIGNNLNNDEDSIYLYYNGTLIDNANYADSAEENYSLEFFNNSFKPSLIKGGTPGKINSYYFMNKTNNTNASDNENNINGECNITLGIEIKETKKYFPVYNNKETIEFCNIIEPDAYSFEIEYWVEDLFGNIIKKPYNTTNSNKKSYTPSIEEEEKVLIIKNRLLSINCSNINNKTSSEKYVIVKNENDALDEDSHIEIKEANPEDIKFGETLFIDLKAYKGNTNKNVIYVYIKGEEKISETTKIYLKSKYMEYEFTIPLKLKDNCKRKYNDGEYEIIAEGLDEKEEYIVLIEGLGNCPEDETNNKEEGEKAENKEKDIQYKLTGYNNTIYIENKTGIKNSLNIYNPDTEPYNITVYSYIYNGPKCYSDEGNRESNKLRFNLKANENRTIELKNDFEGDSGDYSYKIKIFINDEKTAEEITKEIKIMKKDIININKTEKILNYTNKTAENKVTGSAVEYSSKNSKLKNLSGYIVAGIIILGIILFSFKKAQ
ncbi:lamin tail domain-containing protein [Candidatus Woesearchaeota archaeon]|nr:lamin tail domain-containing protein [Candidatus Woesearchaeota archaeon]